MVMVISCLGMSYDDPVRADLEIFIYGQTTLQPVVDPDLKVIQLWTNALLLGAFSGLSFVFCSYTRNTQNQVR